MDKSEPQITAWHHEADLSITLMSDSYNMLQRSRYGGVLVVKLYRHHLSLVSYKYKCGLKYPCPQYFMIHWSISNLIMNKFTISSEIFKKIQATLVTSTMHSSTLPLTSTQTPSPNTFPYMFIAFQQRIIRTTVSSSKRVIQHQFLVPIMNFRSFFDA